MHAANQTDHHKWKKIQALIPEHSISEQKKLMRDNQKLKWIRLLSNNFLILLIQYSGINLIIMSLNSPIIVFATGTALGYLFLRGFSILPGLFIGNFMAYYLAKAGFIPAMAYASVISIQALLILWINHRNGNPSLIFNDRIKYLRFIGEAMVITAGLSLVFQYINFFAIPQYQISWFSWMQIWLAHLSAVLIFACAFITWDACCIGKSVLSCGQKIILGGLFLLLCSMTLASSLSTQMSQIVILGVLSLMVTMGIAIKFSWPETITAVSLIAICLYIADLLQEPAFTSTAYSVKIVFLQAILCFETVLGLSISCSKKSLYF